MKNILNQFFDWCGKLRSRSSKAVATFSKKDDAVSGSAEGAMGLSQYYKMINEVDGVPNPPDNPRITRKDLDFRGGKGKEGSATITFLDGEPVALNWYIWDLDTGWMIEQVEKELGGKVILSNYSGGNGHCSADLELVK
jgi:hypothetical protein